MTETPIAGNVGTALRLLTADGERLSARHLPPLDEATSGAEPDRFAVVLAPGFSGWSGKPAVLQLVAELRRCLPRAGMLVLDLRGHGCSSGETTLGEREVLDIDAAVAEARRLGYPRVVTLGWSMGGTCVLRHAALIGEPVHGCPITAAPDAVATVSAVSRWDDRETIAMRRFHRFISTRRGRAAARVLFRTRIAPGAHVPPPLSPTEAVARVRVPLLVVHGERDHYYGWEHGRALAAAARPAAVLWLVPGFGHAEEAAVRPDVPGFVDRLAAALADLAADRPVPGWEAPDSERSGGMP